MDNQTWQFLLGIAVGIGTNLLSWWILFHLLVPKVRISNSISKTAIEKEPFNKSGYRYRIKLMNVGTRSIIDVQVTAKVRIMGIGHYKKSTAQDFFIPLTPDGLLELKMPIIKTKGKGFNVRFYISSGIIAENPTFLPPEILKKAKQKVLCLEDILSIGTKAYVQVFVFGYDDFSGTRKLFVSEPLTVDNIKEGPFEIGGINIKTTSSKDIIPEVVVS